MLRGTWLDALCTQGFTALRWTWTSWGQWFWKESKAEPRTTRFAAWFPWPRRYLGPEQPSTKASLLSSMSFLLWPASKSSLSVQFFFIFLLILYIYVLNNNLNCICLCFNILTWKQPKYCFLLSCQKWGHWCVWFCSYCLKCNRVSFIWFCWYLWTVYMNDFAALYCMFLTIFYMKI